MLKFRSSMFECRNLQSKISTLLLIAFLQNIQVRMSTVLNFLSFCFVIDYLNQRDDNIII